MRFPRMIAATALNLALLGLCAGLHACTDQSGFAHGDPGRDSGPRASPVAATSTTAAGIPTVFSAVIVTFSEHAQELAAADPRLSPTDVATAVEQEMAAQQLLAPGTAAPPLAITVDDFTSTVASNASVLGFTFRNVMLIGDVTVTGPAGRASIDVHARARLTTRDASGKAGSLAPLYRRFAQLVVADLRGVEPPADATSR